MSPAKLRAGAEERAGGRIEKNATPGSVKEKTFQIPIRTAARWAPTIPTFHASDRLGLDPDDPRPQHRHLERRVPHGQRRGDHRRPVRQHALPLPDTSRADVAIEVDAAQPRRAAVHGHAARALRRRARSTAPVTLEASESERPVHARRCISRIRSCGGRTATASPTCTRSS